MLSVSYSKSVSNFRVPRTQSSVIDLVVLVARTSTPRQVAASCVSSPDTECLTPPGSLCTFDTFITRKTFHAGSATRCVASKSNAGSNTARVTRRVRTETSNARLSLREPGFRRTTRPKNLSLRPFLALCSSNACQSDFARFYSFLMFQDFLASGYN